MASLQFPPYILPSIVAVFTSCTLAILCYRRRNVPSAMILFVLTLSATIWAFAKLMEDLNVDLDGKVFWSKVAYFGILTVIATWPVFVLNHTGHSKWINRRTLSFLGIEGLIILAFVWTNEYHGLIWPSIKLAYLGP